MGIYRSYRLDQRCMGLRHIQMRPVKALTLIGIRQSGKYDDTIPPLGTGGCLFHQRLIDGIMFQLITRCIFKCNAIFAERIQHTIDLMGIDL